MHGEERVALSCMLRGAAVRLVMIAAAVGALLLGACGGGSDSSDRRQEQALRALNLASATLGLNSKVAAIMPRLAGAPTKAERREIVAQLADAKKHADKLGSRAAQLPAGTPGAARLRRANALNARAAGRLEEVAQATASKSSQQEAEQAGANLEDALALVAGALSQSEDVLAAGDGLDAPDQRLIADIRRDLEEGRSDIADTTDALVESVGKRRPAEKTATQPLTRPTGPGSSGGTVDLPAFRMPSDNIGCMIGDQGVRCDIRKYDYSPPRTPSSCHLDWGQTLAVDGESARFLCVGDSVFDPGSPELAYGQDSQAGTFTCASREAGITCTNHTTGHGFFLSRGQYRIF